MDNKRVSFREIKRGERYSSTLQLKLVTIGNDNTPVRVLAPGLYVIPWSYKRKGQCDRIAFVDMTPKQITLQIQGNVNTKDGIAITGSINVQFAIKDDEGSIKRVIINSQEEESLLTNSTLTAFREGILAYNCQKIRLAGQTFVNDAEKRLADILEKTCSCFQLESLTINFIRSEDEEIALTPAKQEKENLARLAEKTRMLHQLDSEKTKLVGELETEKARNQFKRIEKKEDLSLELEEQRLRNQIKIEEMREKILIAAEESMAKMSALKEQAALLKTEEGQMAAFPEQVFAQKTKELELQMAQIRKETTIYKEVMEQLFSNKVAHLTGQIEATNSIHGLRLSIPTAMGLEGKIMQEKETEEAAEDTGPQTENPKPQDKEEE